AGDAAAAAQHRHAGPRDAVRRQGVAPVEIGMVQGRVAGAEAVPGRPLGVAEHGRTNDVEGQGVGHSGVRGGIPWRPFYRDRLAGRFSGMVNEPSRREPWPAPDVAMATTAWSAPMTDPRPDNRE